MEEINYPIRINRYLALGNYCSRREADEYVKKGLVTVNGKKAGIGDKIFKGDKVEFDVKEKGVLKKYVYFAYHKARGIVTHSPKDGQKSIANVVKVAPDVFPIGRLDKNSRGLILLSNDGRITDRLLNPEKQHEKEYVVQVNKPVTNIFLKVMRQGVQLEDFKTRPAIVEKKDEITFHITLTEGKKHQIRRMCAALGWEVVDLKRIRIMNVKLGNLRVGQMRALGEEETKTLLKNLGI